MRVLVLCLAASCATTLPLSVTVRSAQQEPIAGATVAWVCTPSGDAGSVTGLDGLAEATMFNSEPEQCVVTVAKIGYRSVQQTTMDLEPMVIALEEIAP
jgi:hypothetical protein